MSRRSRSALFPSCIAAAFACVLAVGGVAWAAPGLRLNLDPVRTSDARSVAPALLDLAQAEPVPMPATKTAGAPRTTTGQAVCVGDSDCPDNTICEDGACRRIERRTNIFYLYYQEGTFREILGLYWSKRGATGFTVVAPLYWNYFSPTTRTRIVAPFYWRFEDDTARSTLTVIVPGLPVSWSRQPGASSFGVWPLFYVSTKFGWAAPLLGSFKIADPDKGTAFGSVAFLGWWSRNPQGAFDMVLPFYVSKRSPASSFTFALPLNFYWRTGDDARTLAIPFFYRHSWKTGSSTYSLLGYTRHQGQESSGSIAWLYWFGRDEGRNRSSDVLFPFLWSFRGRTSGTSIFFPFVWDFRGRDARTTVVVPILPIVHVRQGTGWFTTVFPFWWSGGNRGDAANSDSDARAERDKKSVTPWRFQMLLPLFFWKETDRGAKFTWLSPIGGYSRDERTKSRTLALLPGLFFRRDPYRAIDVVTPLYIRHHNKDTDATTRLISLLLYLRDDPGGSTKVLFPLFWRFHDRVTDGRATAVLPFFLHRSGPRDSTTFAGIFPVWFYRRQMADGGWGAGLFPLAFFGQRGDAGHGIVFPLFWRFTSAKGSTTAFLPLFFTSGDQSGRDTGMLPLVFFGHHGTSSYQIQFPLFWRFADERTRTATTVTPLGFFGRSPEGWRAGVGPLLPIVWAGGGGPRRHFVLFPLFWHFADDKQDQNTTVVANYLHRRHGGETTDAFFPLLYYRRGARPGGTDETSFTLFPLVHYRKDANTRLLLTPIGASVTGPRRAAGFLGPYLWYQGPNVTAAGIPFLYANVSQANTGERTRQWGPVFAIDGPGRSARVFFPFFGRYQDAHETDTYVFPSYFRQRKADGYVVDTLIPLFWHSRWRERTTTIIGPWYSRQGSEVHNTGLVPFYFWAKNATRTLLCIPPLLTFHHHNFKTNDVTTWVGPFVRRQSPDREATVLFPFWWSGREGQRSHRVLAPFYWHSENAATATAWTLAFPFYWSTQGTLRTRALLPVAWYTRDSEQKTGSEALLPFFYASHGPKHFTILTPVGGVSRSVTERTWYALLLYVSDAVESRTRVLFPVYLNRLNLVTETRTRLFLPFLHFSRSSPEKSLSTWFALFWRRTDVASATTLLLPLFFDVNDYRQKRTTVLFPLFLRHADHTTGESIWLAPLIYRRSSLTTSTTVAFPLLWDFKGKDRRTTVLFPLFARWTRPTHAATYIFPIFYYRKGFAADAPAGTPDGTWRLFVPPLFDAAVRRPGDLRWEILGGLFGKERIGRNHYLKILFFSFQTQKASAVQTSWYGQPRRTTRVRPARGLATNAW